MRNFVLLCITLSVITLSVYVQVRNHDFVSYDDEDYVTNNLHVSSGITVQNIAWAFTSVGETTGNWHPVTWLSHMADVDTYGMNPGGHHLTSVIIHLVSSLLLLLFLFRFTGSLCQSGFVAAMFALHPMHVESVAWVAERKDVLSALFGLLTLLFYSEYAAKRKPALYIAALVFFALGLMSKSMLVTLPLMLLLMDVWPLGRFLENGQEQSLRELTGRIAVLVKEKIPFIALSFFTCILTMYTQSEAITPLPLRLRIENSLVAYVRYIGKTFWPTDLAVLYPLDFSFPLWQVTGSLILLLLVSAATIFVGRRYPYLAVGWFWFLITLIPVIGIIQVGVQSMADRYSYIPLIGLFIMIAWGGTDLTRNWQNRKPVLALLAGAALFAVTTLTWQQVGYWRDSTSLFEHTLQVTSGNYMIHNSLGVVYRDKGEVDKAIDHFTASIRIKPRFTDARTNMGIALVSKGDLDAAIQEFSEVARRNPHDAQAHNNLGFALACKGNVDAAILEYQEALRISPADARANDNLQNALAQKGQATAR